MKYLINDISFYWEDEDYEEAKNSGRYWFEADGSKSLRRAVKDRKYICLWVDDKGAQNVSVATKDEIKIIRDNADYIEAIFRSEDLEVL